MYGYITMEREIEKEKREITIEQTEREGESERESVRERGREGSKRERGERRTICENINTKLHIHLPVGIVVYSAYVTA